MIITPYKITNPSYAYKNTTTVKRQHPISTTETLRVHQNKNGRKMMFNFL